MEEGEKPGGFLLLVLVLFEKMELNRVLGG